MSQTFRIFFYNKRGVKGSLLIQAVDFADAGVKAAQIARLNEFSLSSISTWYGL